MKTRLAEFVGDENAALIYSTMIDHVVPAFVPENTVLFYDNPEGRIPALSAYTARIQQGNNLGDKMARAFRECHLTARLHGNIPEAFLLTGSDVPDYKPEVAEKACRTLSASDAVIVPAGDGGYSMIGFSRNVIARDDFESLFSEIPWSSEKVLSVQVEKIKRAGLSVRLLSPLEDIDTIYDLIKRLKQNDALAATFQKFIPDVRLIMPVLNEAENLPQILPSLNESGFFREIVCVDNGSTDDSAQCAEANGATVVKEPRVGYGQACLAGMDYIRNEGGCDVVLFMDADGADDPDDIYNILAPVSSGQYDMVLGDRRPDLAENGALMPHARSGNKLATRLIKLFWKHEYHDLGPLRAVKWQSLESLNMDDRNFGWTIQMQIRAVKRELRLLEIPVHYRNRQAGKSKVSANVLGSIRAGYIILRTVFREWKK